MEEQAINNALRIAGLLARYLKAEISAEEEKELFDWVNQSESNFRLFAKIVNEQNLETYYKELQVFDTASALEKIRPKLKPTIVKNLKPKYRWYIAAAAAILVMFSAGILVYFEQSKPQTSAYQKNDIRPGGNKAILTLANGSQILLADAKNGKLAVQGNTVINKTANGQISYSAAAGLVAGAPVAFNTVSTPRGGQYMVILPDGTKAWLNAASSLRYPTAFYGKERKVELTGEGYFEVVHNDKSPFRVISNGETIEDIGTHFNVNAYIDEPALITTLLEGKIRVSKNSETAILTPGQQSIIHPINNSITVKNANTDEAVAWKNGYFNFDHADIKTVMRSLSRWYDVDIAYEGNVPERHFTGEIHRNLNASQVLEVLSDLNIDFRIEGKKIIVTDKK